MYKTLYDIKKEYDDIKIKNAMLYEERKNDIYKKFPRLKDIDENTRNLYLLKFKNPGDQSIQKKIDELKSEKENFLNNNGFDKNYLEKIYSCEKCKDTGFIDGKKCSCLIKKEILLINDISNYDEISKTDNFSKVNFSYYKQNEKNAYNGASYYEYMVNAIKHMKQNVALIDEKPFNAIIIGPTGSGKSFLSKCIGSEFYNKGKSVLYITVNDFINSYFQKQNDDDENVKLEPFALKADLLILDDLGLENTPAFFISTFNSIIDKRLNENKSTVITTNLNFNELKERYYENTISRLYGLYFKYFLLGEDLRRIKNGLE